MVWLGFHWDDVIDYAARWHAADSPARLTLPRLEHLRQRLCPTINNPYSWSSTAVRPFRSPERIFERERNKDGKLVQIRRVVMVVVEVVS